MSYGRFSTLTVILACTAALTLAACGDDETTTSTTSTSATGASGATGEGGAVSDADVQQMEKLLVDQGGYTQEEAECMAPKVLDEAGSLPDKASSAQKLIDASMDALNECGATP